MSELSKSVSASASSVEVTNVVSVSTPLSELDDILVTLVQEGEELRNASRLHLANVKKVVALVSKERKYLRKHRKKTKRVIKQNPQKVNKQMQKFMKDNRNILSTGEIPVSSEYVRRDMMRVVSAYVKVNNLQIESNRKKWIPDKTIKKLFAVTEKNAEFSFMNVNGLITRVILK